MSPPEAEMGAVAVTAPPKPGTPRGPLITGMRVDSMSFDHRKPIPPCKCVPVMGNPWGQHDTCFTDFPSPGVSLTRKVRDLFFFFVLKKICIQIFCSNYVKTLESYRRCGNNE